MSALIEFDAVCKYYQMGDTTVKAADHITMKIDKGEFVAIVGKSGSGKSTLMNIIGALDVPTEGEYFLGGEDVADMSDNELAEIRNRMIGFIFQQYNLLSKLNLLENVELPLLYAGYDKKERRERAMNSLKRVGLEEKWKNLPNQLSGGQQQRVSIARALAGDPSLILADEPTGALDSRTGREVLDFLKKLNEEGNTIVMITHDLGVVANIADRVAVMYAGDIVEIGTADEIYYDPRHPYTWALLSSMPQMGIKGEDLFNIVGTPPNLFAEIRGDAFAPRNPQALKIDYVKRPPYFEVSHPQGQDLAAGPPGTPHRAACCGEKTAKGGLVRWPRKKKSFWK